MEVIYLSRSNSGQPHPFIEEQATALLKNFGIRVQHVLISKGGIKGYINAINQLSDFIKTNKADIIHVHYGLWALVAIISRFLSFRKQKIIITYHGSDINKATERQFSLLAAQFSSHNILVSDKMLKYVKKNCSVIPCGIDTNVQLTHRESTRAEKGWGDNEFVILFSSSFKRKEKDPDFAFKVVDEFSKLTSKTVLFVELTGYTRDEVTKLMQASDALIMCSEREGSPQVIKEAILNSLPVVANDVGDVKSICAGADNCFIVPKEVDEFIKCLLFLSQVSVRVQNRTAVIEKYDNNLISQKLFSIYTQAINGG